MTPRGYGRGLRLVIAAFWIAGVIGVLPRTAAAAETTATQLPVTFAASGPCQVESGALQTDGTTTAQVTLSGAGNCQITASQAGDATYAAAAPVTRSFTVNQAPTALTLGALPTTPYHDAVSLSATVSPAVVSGSAATGTVVFAIDGTTVGSAPVNSSGVASASVTVTQTPGPHDVTAAFTSSNPNLADSASTSPSTLTVTTEDATLTSTGDTNGGYHDPVTMKALLLEDGDSTKPVSGKSITFTLGTQSCDATTSDLGLASCPITLMQAPASVTAASAAFAGDTLYAATSSATAGFTGQKEETSVSYTGAGQFAAGSRPVVTALLKEDGTIPLGGKSVRLTFGTAANAPSCTGTTTASGVASCMLPALSAALGNALVTVSFAGDSLYLPASDTSHHAVIYGSVARGAFVLGDRTAQAAAGTSAPISYWGPSWSKANSLSGGIPPSSFFGFARTLSKVPPVCGATWTTSPGASSLTPPVAPPAYMAVLVASRITQVGSVISGNVVKIAIVKTGPGGLGTGTVLSTFCPGSATAMVRRHTAPRPVSQDHPTVSQHAGRRATQHRHHEGAIVPTTRVRRSGGGHMTGLPRSLHPALRTAALGTKPQQITFDPIVDHTVGDPSFSISAESVTTPVQTGGLPPDPSTVAPPIDGTVATTIGTATAFLYSGDNPIQTGVAPGTIDPLRACVLRGTVLDKDGNPLSGVSISILDHPELGQTLSRADGRFDLAVNGGGYLTVNYAKDGYFPVQRQITTPWQDYAALPDVVMIAQDPQVTAIDLTSSDPIQVAQGSQMTDADGTRQATLLFPQGTTATMTMPDGSTQPLSTLHVRATEFTVGPNGPAAMPGTLPPASGYTYAADFSADEAQQAGATRVQFNHPIISYLQNFLNFPVGEAVPTGSYDRTQGKWIAENNGRVIKILSITNGMADLDLDGSGQAADSAALAALGVTDAERTQLASLYTAGDTLWRVPIPHFSIYDDNWPFVLDPPESPPPPANPGPGGPGGNPPGNPKPNPDPCKANGSIIGCLAQSLGDDVAVTGTPFSLHYESERAVSEKDAYTLNIPLTGDNLPFGLLGVELRVYVAGRQFIQTFSSSPNQSYTFTWDGKDAYGRLVQGRQPYLVEVGFRYYAHYADPGPGPNAFGEYSFVPTGDLKARLEATYQDTLFTEWTGSIGVWRQVAQGLGGWSLDVQHAYDPNSRTLYLGDGSRRDSDSLTYSGAAVSNVAGFGIQGSCFPSTAACGDGGPALRANFSGGVTRVATDAAGEVYIADTSANRIRRIGTDGVITTVAGSGVACPAAMDPCGDGGPATQAQLNSPYGIAVAPDGTVFIADANDNRIRRVDPSGVITTAAGTGVGGFAGDDGPATRAQLAFPQGVSVGPDGSLYIADTNNWRIRRVAPDGTMTTAAGDGSPDCLDALTVSACAGGDGGPAVKAHLWAPSDVLAAPDGTVYIADTSNERVRSVSPAGIITTIAGSGTRCSSLPCGDGGLATQAQLDTPSALALAPDGLLYVLAGGLVRALQPNGIIVTAIGGGVNSPAPGTPSGDVSFNRAGGVAATPDGNLLIGQGFTVIRSGRALTGLDRSDRVIPSSDGSELYVFDQAGRHMRTLDALTGAPRYLFNYDSSGLLTQVKDGSGNVTTIERDSAGTPTAIDAPGGQRTVLTVDGNGYLSSIADPAGDTYRLVATPEGALTSFTDPNGNQHTFQYNAGGRLTLDQNPAGGSSTLVRTDAADGSGDYSVALTTALGRTTTYAAKFLPTGDRQFTTTDPSGAKTTTVLGSGGVATTTYPDGSTITVTQGPDPRWGMLSPLAASIVRTTPGGLTQTFTDRRTVTLAHPDDPLSLATLTDWQTMDGHDTVTTYDAATRTSRLVTAAGRTSSVVFDSLGRVSTVNPAGGIDPINSTYDTQGNLTEVTQGGRTITYTYDAKQRLSSRTDAAGHIVQYAYDAADRLTSMAAPTGAITRVSYDANGNAATVTMPSGAVHTLTATSIDQPASYTPPGNAGYGTTYDTDGAPQTDTLPTGRTESYSYDSGGRPTGISYPEASNAFSYGDATNQVSGVTRTAGSTVQTLGLSYDGFLPTGESMSGTTQGQYSYAYNADLLESSIKLVSGSDTVSTAITRDADQLLTGYGSFTFDRSGPGGLTAGISDGTLAMSLGYDSFGRTTSRSQTVNGTPAYSEALTYNGAGLISQKIETIGGTAHTFGYRYDANGQLTDVTQDGTTTEQYSYDLNGNRTSRTLDANPTQTATYDVQDRLTGQGGTSYAFDADGFLQSRGADAFQYSTRGELLSAIVGGSTITYTYDGLGRRIARTDNSGTTQYLYGRVGNPFQITEVRDPSGTLISLYYDNSGLLYAMQRGGSRYYVATDQVGTPRVVTDSTGAVVKTLSYDSYGDLTGDSAPSFFLPIGFAGGLADAATGLVHFGNRDYDPGAGRWTARDPGLYDSGQANLYVYVANSPVGLRDPTGLFCIGGSAYDGIGGGADLCITDKGLSVCAELGIGVGEELSVKPDGGLANDFVGPSLEASAGISGVLTGTVGLSQNVLNPCTGTEATLNINAGGANMDVLSGKGKDILNLTSQNPSFPGVKGPLSAEGRQGLGKSGVEGKAALKTCSNVNW